MSKTFNNALTASEINDIETRALRVRESIKMSTSAWLAVAAEFATVKGKYNQLGYETFVNVVGVTKSVADKLVKIGKCKTLYVESNLETISTVEGWTVLYELAILEEKKLTSLLDIVVRENKKITRELINNFETNQPLDAKRLIVCLIEIDEQKLNTLSSEKFNFVKQQIASVQRQIDSINAGFVLKQRDKTLKTLAERATANSAMMITQTAA